MKMKSPVNPDDPAALSLQINDSGAWKNVVKFNADEIAFVIKAASALAKIAGPKPKWRIANAQGALLFPDKTIRDVSCD